MGCTNNALANSAMNVLITKMNGGGGGGASARGDIPPSLPPMSIPACTLAWSCRQKTDNHMQLQRQ